MMATILEFVPIDIVSMTPHVFHAKSRPGSQIRGAATCLQVRNFINSKKIFEKVAAQLRNGK